MSDERLNRIFSRARDVTASSPARLNRVRNRVVASIKEEREMETLLKKMPEADGKSVERVRSRLKGAVFDVPRRFATRAAAVPAALGVTLGLFLMMHRLIGLEMVVEDGGESAGSVDFVRLKRETATKKKERTLPDKPERQRQPRTPKMEMPNVDATAATGISVSSPDVDTGIDMGGLTKGVAGDTEAVPVVRIEPVYPRNAAQMQLEGWVTVGFDVGPSGQVLNASILEADPARIFDRAALNAVKKWKYKPQFRDGKPATTRGLSVRLTFQLEK